MWLMLIPDCSAWLFLSKAFLLTSVVCMYPRSAFHGSLALAKRRSSGGGKVVGSSGLDATAVDRLRLSLFPCLFIRLCPSSSVWLPVCLGLASSKSVDGRSDPRPPIDMVHTCSLGLGAAAAGRGQRSGNARPMLPASICSTTSKAHGYYTGNL